MSTKRVLGGALPLVFALGSFACSNDPEVPTLEILTHTLPDVALGAAYDQKVDVRGGTTPYAFSITVGALPDGLSLASATGQISGSAGTPGPHPFTLQVKDASGATATMALAIYVTPEALVIETALLAEAQETVAYTQALTASGGVPPYVWSISSGVLPTGLTLGDSEIHGSPSQPGTFELTVHVADQETKTAERAMTLVVRSLDPMIRTSTIPDAAFGHGFHFQFEADGGRPPYVWSVVSGTLPLSVTLGPDGIMSGAPLDSGDFSFVVRVTDAGGRHDEALFPLHVIPPLLLVTTRIPQVLANRPFDFAMEASGGQPPYAWGLVSGVLPAGLMLERNGHLHGLSTVGSRSNVTIGVTDALGTQKAGAFVVEVNDRFTYGVTPTLAFPASCTATVTASYTSLQIPVTDSMQIDDLDVAVDMDFTDPTAPASNRNTNLKLVLLAPNGQRAVLCGGGAGLRQEPGCRGSNGVHTSYDDLATPFTALRVFKGLNTQGTWTFIAIIARGEFGADACRQSGTINAVTLKFRADEDPSPYVRVTGYDTNELIVDPWVRLRFFNSVPDRELFLTATMYGAGPNGKREGGAGDDVPDPTHVFTWHYEGAATVAVSISADGHVEGLGPDRTCLTQDTRRCGTGEGEAVADDGQGTVVRKRVLVVPPDWNPLSRSF